MKRGLIVVFFVMLLVLPLASAALTELRLKTLPVHDISVFILSPESRYESLYSYGPVRTGFNGTVNFTFDVDKPEVGVQVLIKKDGDTVFSDRLKNQITGGVIELSLLEEDIGLPAAGSTTTEEATTEGTNTTEGTASEENKTEETSEGEVSRGITGSTVKNIGKFFSKAKIYIFGFIGLLLIIIIIAFLISKKGSIGSIGSFSSSLNKALKTDNRPPTILEDSKELENAERKIREAEREIREIKELKRKRTRLDDAKKRFDEAKEELEKAQKAADEK